MSSDKHSKTEKPTAKRRMEAKQEGNVPRTNDLSGWLTIFVVVMLGPMAVDGLRELFRELFAQVPVVIAKPDTRLVTPILGAAMLGFGKVVAPIAFGCMLVGVVGHVIQGGTKPSSKRFKVRWNKLNPVPGIKNMFGAQGTWTLIKTLIKFVVFGIVAYEVVSPVITQITASGRWSLGAVVNVGGAAAFSVLRLVAFTGIVIAGADWIMEKRRHEKSLMMTKEEVKQESKMTEGDPHVKTAIRQRARELARSRMIADVAEATVVMTNPTHIAVALAYEPGGGAPKVVAKGAGHLAARIREAAEENDVPMVRDVIVARMLYKLCEVGHFIPAELYDAIAQVIAFVFFLDEMGKAAGTHESPVVHPEGDEPGDDLSDAALGIATASDDDEDDERGTPERALSAGSAAHA